MAVSRNSEHRSERTILETLTGRLSRYDLLLAVMPAVLSVALVLGVLLPVPLHLSAAGGALVGAALVADAVYFHPPTEESGTDLSRSD